MWNPWGTLRKLTHIAVIWRRPHPLLPAATDGMHRVWIDPRANQVERRCLLAHELVHLERGHIGCQPPAVERTVRVETARRLVPLAQLQRHLSWARSSWELADELHVTEMVLRDRLEALSESERQLLARADLHH